MKLCRRVMQQLNNQQAQGGNNNGGNGSGGKRDRAGSVAALVSPSKVVKQQTKLEIWFDNLCDRWDTDCSWRKLEGSVLVSFMPWSMVNRWHISCSISYLVLVNGALLLTHQLQENDWRTVHYAHPRHVCQRPELNAVLPNAALSSAQTASVSTMRAGP